MIRGIINYDKIGINKQISTQKIFGFRLKQFNEFMFYNNIHRLVAKIHYDVYIVCTREYTLNLNIINI